MLWYHQAAARRTVVSDLELLSFSNVSEVVLVIPKRIVARVWLNDKMIWEATCPSEINPQVRPDDS